MRRDRVFDRVAGLVERHWGASVRDVTLLSGGSSRETWRVDVDAPDAPGPLVLQRQSDAARVTGASCSAQAAAMRLASSMQVPVPEVHVLLREEDGLGEGFLCDAVPGEAEPHRLWRRPDLSELGSRVVAQAGQALARIHAIPSDRLPPPPGLPRVQRPLADQLADVRDMVDRVEEAHPALELGMRWLYENPPGSVGPVLVHGDFRMGNLLIGADGLDAVLDWELAHVGDPREDLAWFCLRAWRFGRDELPAGGLGTREQLLEAYAHAGGHPFTVDDLAPWEVLGALRWATICMLQASRHLDEGRQSLEWASIGRRACEAEHDLLMLLAELAPDIYRTAARVDVPVVDDLSGGAQLTDRPSAVQLLDAVSSFLTQEVRGHVQGRTAYLTRVAANVCRIVGREIALGSALDDDVSQRLAALLGNGDDLHVMASELSHRIREGRVEPAEVAADIGALVRAKLAICNPGHLQDIPSRPDAPSIAGGLA